MCVCSPITLTRLVDFHEIWWAGNTTEGDLDAVNFSLSFNHFKMDEIQISQMICTIQPCPTMGWKCLALLGFHDYATYHL
jgi:hypothetical protein